MMLTDNIHYICIIFTYAKECQVTAFAEINIQVGTSTQHCTRRSASAESALITIRSVIAVDQLTLTTTLNK